MTGVVVARTDFVKEHPQAVETFLSEYEASVAYTNDNAADAAESDRRSMVSWRRRRSQKRRFRNAISRS